MRSLSPTLLQFARCGEELFISEIFQQYGNSDPRHARDELVKLYGPFNVSDMIWRRDSSDDLVKALSVRWEIFLVFSNKKSIHQSSLWSAVDVNEFICSISCSSVLDKSIIVSCSQCENLYFTWHSLVQVLNKSNFCVWKFPQNFPHKYA